MRQYACDLCHSRAGVRFMDRYWACAFCAVLYLSRLEREPGHLGPQRWAA